MIVYGIIIFYALCAIFTIYEMYNAPLIEDDFFD